MAVAATLLAGLVPAAPDAAAAPARGSASQIVSLCDTEIPVGHARCFAEAEVPTGAEANGATPRGLTPADLLAAYKLPARGGAGMTIGVVDAFSSPSAAADLAVYRSTFGLPALRTGQLRIVDQRGGTALPAPDPGWAGEIALDLDAVSAVAPLADIVLVEADSAAFTDLGTAVQQAVAAGADVVSNSYGSRYSSGPGAGENPDQLAQDAQYYDHPGVAIVASTGDDGYGVAFPAASPHVTAVGGTSLKVAAGSARGWKETAWDGAGSGCSAVQPEPAWQTGTGCDHRATADVSAVADPRTGLASYNTYSGHGWGRIGGTSLAAPVVAGVYALAGKPVAGTEPVTYPWSKPGALFDVTGGSNGGCDPAPWCTAGRGWDGPTGLGTPNGTTAFSTGPHGTIAGVVTSTAAGHAPVAAAAVTATRTDGAADASDRATAVTDADGHYTLTVTAGRWQVGAVAYSSYDGTSGVVTVKADTTTTTDLALRPRAVRTVSGRVTDASGHGWALPATVGVEGLAGAPVPTVPTTGRFTLGLPAGRTYTLHVTSAFPGYLPVTRAVRVGATDVTSDVAMTVDPFGVAPPGYATRFAGAVTQDFAGAAPPAGWTVTDTGDAPAWFFDDPAGRTNQTGGTGGFAIADSDHAGQGHHEDSVLTSPAADLRTAAHPVVEFDTYLNPYDGQTTTVELSTDGGTTWSTVWTPVLDGRTVSGRVSVPLPTAAHRRSVRVRFHFTGTWATWWEVDDVAIGERTQAAVPGGLVLARAVDVNTGDGVAAVTVTGPGTAAGVTGGGVAVGPTRLEVFAPLGTTTWTASRPGYRTARLPVTVPADRVTAVTFPLPAGRTAAAVNRVQATVAPGGTATASFTVTNTGSAPVTVRPGEQASGYDVPAGNAAAVDVPAVVSRRAPVVRGGGADATTAAAVAAAGRGAWRSLAAPPVALQDNAAATGAGAVWSVGGYDGRRLTAALYRFDLQHGTWSRRADASVVRAQGSAAFIGGKLYVTGGADGTGGMVDRTEVYDPATNTWTTLAALPTANAAMGSGVVDGKLYVVGGCNRDTCGLSDVQVYDPATDAWDWVPGPDNPVSYTACGGIDGALYCAGGTTDANTPVTATWRYDPAPRTWTRLADLPTDQWGGAVAVGGGQLLVSGGVVGNTALTNRSWAYDPRLDRWAALPPAPVPSYRGGGTTGLFTVGGSTGTATPLRTTSVLPGFGEGAVANAPWLSVPGATIRLVPGASARVTVTLTAGAVTPVGGDDDAAVVLDDDSPYPAGVVRVRMQVR